MEKMFVCPICGEKYSSIAALNVCVGAHAAEEAESEKNQKLAKQKAVNEINIKYREFKELIDKFNEDFDESYSVSFRFSSGDTTIGEEKETSSDTSENFEDFLKGIINESEPKNKEILDEFKKLSEKLCGGNEMDSFTKKLYEDACKELEETSFSAKDAKELSNLFKLIGEVID